MKLSISNIAWDAMLDDTIYRFMQELGCTGLEIAPTRLFPDNPYDHRKEAAAFSRHIKEAYGLSVCSMQSIWYGRREKLFGTPKERQLLLDYTKKAIDFAEALNCPSLVFGCPRNRQRPDGAPLEPVLELFRELGSYAAAHGAFLAFEPNPPLYNTNFINTTAQACELARLVNTPAGFGINLDLGTVLANQEALSNFPEWLPYVRHIHISEPGLCPPKEENASLHRELAAFLQKAWEDGSYGGYVSIEMSRQDSLPVLIDVLCRIRSLFP